MKRPTLLAAVLSIGFLCLVPEMTPAQDPVQVAPNAYKKVLFENERVRVCEIEIAAGDKVPQHSHPDHLAYILDPGTLKITKTDGTSTDAQFQKGQVAWIPAETHRGENIGSTTMRAIIIELKEAAPKAAAPAKKM